MQIVQIVRNFSQRGGMERYVWELVQTLAQKGFDIIVICEVSATIAQSSPNLRVLEVGRSTLPFSWLRLLDFSRRVHRLLGGLQIKAHVIHSHERTSVHNITTFHGPPFAKIHDYPWFRKLSLRVWAYLWMEQRELCRQKVTAIVPNSVVIKREIAQYYSCAGVRLVDPITPGVAWVNEKKFQLVSPDAGVIGFVGKEWKRKGLAFFLRIISELLVIRPRLHVLIVGPEESSIKNLLKNFHGDYECVGWQVADQLYQRMDLLLHPAASEPYGMVVAEAMSARVPVIVSSACGASVDVGRENGEVLDLNQPVQDWVRACDKWLNIKSSPPKYSRSWGDVADEYAELYRSIQPR